MLRLYVAPISATLILLGINSAIAIVFGGLAARSTPGHVEREALRVRRQALDAARGALPLAAVLPVTTNSSGPSAAAWREGSVVLPPARMTRHGHSSCPAIDPKNGTARRSGGRLLSVPAVRSAGAPVATILLLLLERLGHNRLPRQLGWLEIGLLPLLKGLRYDNQVENGSSVVLLDFVLGLRPTRVSPRRPCGPAEHSAFPSPVGRVRSELASAGAGSHRARPGRTPYGTPSAYTGGLASRRYKRPSVPRLGGRALQIS